MAWRDVPPEKWNATHLAGYFDEQTYLHLHGRSADRFVLKPMLSTFAMLRREGMSSPDCKRLVDIFVQRELSQPGKVDSLWKRFISQRGKLAILLTSNATGHYNNQPKPDDSDDSDESRWM